MNANENKQLISSIKWYYILALFRWNELKKNDWQKQTYVQYVWIDVLSVYVCVCISDMPLGHKIRTNTITFDAIY